MNGNNDFMFGSDGFSLIETLMAVFMLSVVSLISLNIMSSFSDANQMMAVKTSDMEDIKKARDYLREDLANALSGKFSADGNTDANEGYLFTLIRGNSEIASVNTDWSSAEQIEYLLIDEKLIRRSYDRPNPLENTSFRDYVLLDHVKDVNIRSYDGSIWKIPTPAVSNTELVLTPRALEITWQLIDQNSSHSFDYINRFQVGREK